MGDAPQGRVSAEWRITTHYSQAERGNLIETPAEQTLRCISACICNTVQEVEFVFSALDELVATFGR